MQIEFAHTLADKKWERKMPNQCPKCGYVRSEKDAAPSTECPSCGVIFSKFKLTCPRCNHVALADEIKTPGMCPECGVNVRSFISAAQAAQKSVAPKAESIQSGEIRGSKNTKQMLGFIGSIILFVGVFTPIVSAPILGNVNYFQNGKGDGVIVLILALVSFFLALTRNYKQLWFTGLGSIGVILFTFINFQLKMSEMTAKLESELEGNPFRGLADMTIQSVQLQWGWPLLIVGAGLLIASAALKHE